MENNNTSTTIATYALCEDCFISFLELFDFLHDRLLEGDVAPVDMLAEVFCRQLHRLYSVHDRARARHMQLLLRAAQAVHLRQVWTLRGHAIAGSYSVAVAVLITGTLRVMLMVMIMMIYYVDFGHLLLCILIIILI